TQAVEPFAGDLDVEKMSAAPAHFRLVHRVRRMKHGGVWAVGETAVGIALGVSPVQQQAEKGQFMGMLRELSPAFVNGVRKLQASAAIQVEDFAEELPRRQHRRF